MATCMKVFSIILLASLACCEPPVAYRPGFQNGYNQPANHYLPPHTGYNPPNGYLPPNTGYPEDFHDQSHHGHIGHGHHGHDDENEEPKAYEFGYSVKDAATGNDYNRRETSDGNEVRGEYRVQLPDGRTQIVTYHADWQTGFHADVRYEGQAQYPENNNLNGGYNSGYNYNAPEFSGSLNGFHGNSQQLPKPSYGPPFHVFSIILLASLACCEPPVAYRPGFQNGYNQPANHYLPPHTGYNPPNGYLPPNTGYPEDFHGQSHHGHTGHGHHDENEEPKAYEFGYSVKDAATGNDYNRRETSDGNEVRGEYRVQLPDGRTQIVTYHADWQTGFHADVRYEGQAQYPENNNLNGGYNSGYNYNAPEFSGSLNGFHGNSQQLPKPSYGPPFH